MPEILPEADRNAAARETILARVREALQTPAPLPHLQTDLAAEMLGQPVATDSQPAGNGLPLLTVLPETPMAPMTFSRLASSAALPA